MSQVKIGPKFFSNELKVYRDWVAAFWRENLQNSNDAGASRIDITIGNEVDGVVAVKIVDNGSGMTRDILQNVYFTLGETTKTGNSVGGFGKARILTCFAQKGYTLRTNNLYVTGCGAEYSINEVESFHKGVDLEVEVYTNGRDLIQPLADYLKRCHLHCAVYINGNRWTEWTLKNKFERDLSFGKVYTNKSKEAGVLVRVNGVQMFSPHCSAPFLVIIEVDETKSRSVLQSSRDGLLFQYQNELESFVGELNINKQSALRSKRSKSIKYEGTGTFTSNRSKKKDAEKEVEEFMQLLAANNLQIADDSFATKLTNASETGRKNAIREILKNHDLLPVATAEIAHSSGFEAQEAADEVSLDMDLFNVMVSDNTTNAKVRKVIESYYPQNWDLLGKHGSRYDKAKREYVSFRAGVEKYKLLVLWKAAAEYMIRLLQDNLQVGGDSIAWGVGWAFSDSAAAVHKTEGDGIHWLLVNPCQTNGNMKFSISTKRDLIKLISYAAHEVCHIIYSDHDERAMNLLNDLMEEAMANLGDVLSFMKTAKDEAVERLDRMSVAA